MHCDPATKHALQRVQQLIHLCVMQCAYPERKLTATPGPAGGNCHELLTALLQQILRGHSWCQPGLFSHTTSACEDPPDLPSERAQVMWLVVAHRSTVLTAGEQQSLDHKSGQ